MFPTSWYPDLTKSLIFCRLGSPRASATDRESTPGFSRMTQLASIRSQTESLSTLSRT